jgi:hypothetical protein
MKLPRYELKAEKTLMIFEFISEGKKGSIPKLIKFSETSLKDFYNLAFGDKDDLTGEIDGIIITDNGDSEQVLATVVSAVYAFTEKYKGVWVYATGSSKSRTRLYRRGIAKYYDEVKKDFLVYGLLEGEWVPFKKDVDYSAFVVRRK